jgi:acetyl esterase/lipase
MPAALICMSPWADLANTAGSHTANAETDVLLTTAMLDLWASAYAGGARLDDPYLSPIYGDFRDFPPILIQADRGEILLDDSRTLAEKARAAGVDVTLSVWEGLWHVWPALGGLIPESEAAFREMGEFLAAHSL